MFRHTLLLAYRSFRHFKSTFFINLMGLSTGLAGALLIYLWVSDELSVDKFHEKDSRLYQVMNNVKYPGSRVIETQEWTPFPLAQALREEMPEVENVVSVFPYLGGKKGILTVGNTSVKAGEQYASQDFFRVFSYPLLQRAGTEILKNKHSVVISEELAYSLFHTTGNIIGKTVHWEQDKFSGSYIISGVFKKPPKNATAQFDIVFSFDLFHDKTPLVDEWSEGACINYLVLNEGVNQNQWNKKI